MPEKYLITSALPYANGPLHFGHIAGAYLPGDCFARFQRLKGNDVLYICGSDEYGIAITMSADLAGRTPRQQVDIFHEINKNFFEKLNILFDNYSRTTWPGHVPTVQNFFLDLLNNGYIEERTENHLFSVKENKFLADRYVIGICPKCGFDKARGDECPKCAASYEATDLKKPKSRLTGSELILKPSKHWYLRFDKFKDELTKWIDKKDWKKNVINLAKEYIKDLKPRAITRDSDWGVPLPLKGVEGKVLYVWFDAPIGYISSTKEWAEKRGTPEAWKDYWLEPKTKLIHFIGKDNIPFHTVFFPAMIMGQNVPYILPAEVPANEFFLLEGRQFSKSDGWYIDLEDFFKKYSTDQIRYYLGANAPETADSEFTWKDFQVRCNAELLGKLGNFVNRTLVFTKNYLDGKIPKIKTIDSDDRNFLDQMNQAVQRADEAYSNFQVRKAAQILMELAQAGNVYFDTKKPWVLVKDNASREELETTIALCLACIKNLSLIAYPIIPSSAEEIWKMLGYISYLGDQNWAKVKDSPIPFNQKISEPKILFRKVEDEEISDQINKLQKGLTQPAKKEEKTSSLKEQVSFEDVEKLDLRVGQILAAEKVEKSKKLLKLKVDIGIEQRQIVAGIGQSFEPDALIGKKVVVVANLKPAKLMGVESQGMILVGGDKELELPFIKDLAPGSIVS